MNKRIGFIVIVSIFATPAFAQSSVTLYGVIDEGLDFTNNVGGSHVYEMRTSLARQSVRPTEWIRKTRTPTQ